MEGKSPEALPSCRAIARDNLAQSARQRRSDLGRREVYWYGSLLTLQVGPSKRPSETEGTLDAGTAKAVLFLWH
jgi:hypothetical protein